MTHKYSDEDLMKFADGELNDSDLSNLPLKQKN